MNNIQQAFAVFLYYVGKGFACAGKHILIWSKKHDVNGTVWKEADEHENCCNFQ